MKNLPDILFHMVYRDGKLINSNFLTYPGQYKNIPSDLCEMLDGIEVEDLCILRSVSSFFCGQYSYPMPPELEELPEPNVYKDIYPENNLVTPEDIHKECERRITRMKEGKGMLSAFGDVIYPIIKANRFSVKNQNRKISPSLYATEDDINTWLYPIEDRLHDNKDIENWREAYGINNIVRMYNPYFKALKTSKEFANRRLEDLYSVVYDYISMLYGMKPGERFRISSEIVYPEIYDNRHILYPCTKKDLQPLIEYARKLFGQKRFLQVPQNKVTNTLISSLVDKPTAGQLDILHAFEMQVNNNFILKFEDVQLSKDDVNPITVKSTNGMKTLVLFLHEYAKSGNNKGDVRISLSDIQEKRNYSSITTARKQTLAALNELSKIGFQVKEKGKFSGYIRLNGGTHYIKNGYVYWNWNQDFLPIIDNAYFSDLPIEGLATDDKHNPNAFYLTVFISNSYRMNEGKPREGKISVKSLIENCPDLKKYQDTDRIKQLLMDPLIRDLDSLEWVNYTWHDPTGKVIDNIYDIPSKDFLKCYILIDFSEFPKHERRLKARERKERQTEKALINARAKLQAKQEQQNNTP